MSSSGARCRGQLRDLVFAHRATPTAVTRRWTRSLCTRLRWSFGRFGHSSNEVWSRRSSSKPSTISRLTRQSSVYSTGSDPKYQQGRQSSVLGYLAALSICSSFSGSPGCLSHSILPVLPLVLSCRTTLFRLSTQSPCLTLPSPPVTPCASPEPTESDQRSCKRHRTCASALAGPFCPPLARELTLPPVPPFNCMLRRLSHLTHPHRTLSYTLSLSRTMSLFTTNRLEGKTVLVTGASGGIGAATAILFSSVRSALSLVLVLH